MSKIKIDNISELKSVHDDINNLLEENEKICGKFLALNIGINFYNNIRYCQGEEQVSNIYANRYFVLTTNKKIIMVLISDNLIRTKKIKFFTYDEVDALQIFDMSQLDFIIKKYGVISMMVYEEEDKEDMSREYLEALDCIITNLGEGKVKIKEDSKQFLHMWIILIIIIAVAFITYIKGNLI